MSSQTEPLEQSEPRVLIADDDADIVRLVERRLGFRGYFVATASTGAEALESLSSAPFDVAIVDWVMPGMEGVEVCRRIRANPGTSELPIVLLTARAAESDVHEGVAAGASAFLTKPFDIGELDEVLKGLIAASAREG